MKRNIITLLITVFAMLQATAQTYDNLWKQADIIAQKDQPKSEIGVMKKIISKATAAKDYGQLLAAEMRQMILWKEISADSLTPNVKRMKAESHVEVLLGYTPEEVRGDRRVSALAVRNKAGGSLHDISVDGVFVEAGGIPNNSYLPEEVKINSLGEIMTDKEGETSVDGLFAAGDVTDCRNKQIIIAAGEGAAAALAAHEYLLRTEP